MERWPHRAYTWNIPHAQQSMVAASLVCNQFTASWGVSCRGAEVDMAWEGGNVDVAEGLGIQECGRLREELIESDFVYRSC